MTKFHYFLIRTTYYDPDVTGFNAWKRQWSLPVVSRIVNTLLFYRMKFLLVSLLLRTRKKSVNSPI